MIDVRIEIIEYDKDLNTCKGRLLNGDIVDVDPFVGCAISMTDEEYQEGKGFSCVGRSYILTEYSVYRDNIVPHECGMIEL